MPFAAAVTGQTLGVSERACGRGACRLIKIAHRLGDRLGAGAWRLTLSLRCWRCSFSPRTGAGPHRRPGGRGWGPRRRRGLWWNGLQWRERRRRSRWGGWHAPGRVTILAGQEEPPVHPMAETVRSPPPEMAQFLTDKPAEPARWTMAMAPIYNCRRSQSASGRTFRLYLSQRDITGPPPAPARPREPVRLVGPRVLADGDGRQQTRW